MPTILKDFYKGHENTFVFVARVSKCSFTAERTDTCRLDNTELQGMNLGLHLSSRELLAQEIYLQSVLVQIFPR